MAGDDHGTQKEEPEADRQKAEIAEEEPVRSPGEAKVPDGHEGSGGEREGSIDPAVQAGPDLEVDKGQDPRQGEPPTPSRVVHIRLGGPTAYTDYPAIPERFSRDFLLHVYEPGADNGILHPSVDPTIYSGDVVSDTIRDLGVWEVPQTIFACSAFAAAPRGTKFIDIGSHIGWYSALALSFGLDVIAVDGDSRGLELLQRSQADNEWGARRLTTRQEFVGEGWEGISSKAKNLIVKIDLEGNEIHAWKAMVDWFAYQRVTHCLMEVSPVFGDYYPRLLRDIIDLGYEVWVMPPKVPRPAVFDDTADFLQAECTPLHWWDEGQLDHWCSYQHQFDVIIAKPGAEWG